MNSSAQSQPCADAEEALAPHSITPDPKNGTVEAIIASLCDQVERAEDKAERWRAEVLQRRKEAAAQDECIAALTEALRPFAAIAATIGDGWDGERRAYTLNLAPLKIHHLRRAAALVAARNASPQGNSGRPNASSTPAEKEG